jgi:ribonuclease-3
VTDEDEEALAAVEAGLGHRFDERGLLLDALTHSSFRNERPAQAPTDNERLEFFGDAILQSAVSLLLWERFPDAPAGEMTRRRADLVCEQGLADIAMDVGIGPALRLGRGEERSGGRDKPRLLASAFEACVAAVQLDGGVDAALSLCRRLFGPRLLVSEPGARDFKTRLQEALVGLGRRPPRYEIIDTQGPDHARSFEVAVASDGDELARGCGRSKLEAEQRAAEQALASLQG